MLPGDVVASNVVARITINDSFIIGVLVVDGVDVGVVDDCIVVVVVVDGGVVVVIVVGDDSAREGYIGKSSSAFTVVAVVDAVPRKKLNGLLPIYDNSEFQ